MERRTLLTAGATLAAGVRLGIQPARAVVRPAPARLPAVQTEDGAMLHVRDWGRGEPAVLFVHGWPLQAAMWQYQMMAPAEAGCRAIAYDQRGYGRSSDPGTGYGFDRLADDLAVVIDWLKLRRVVLVGHSIGAGQIVRYLTRHGADRVAGIVLIAASLPYIQQSPDNPDGIDPAHFVHVRQRMRTDMPGWLEAAAKNFFAPDTSPDTVQWGIRLCQENSLWAMTQTCRTDVETDFRQELPKLRIRTLVIHGDDDRSCRLETTGRRLAALIPDARLLVYPGARHGLFLSHMDRLNADLLAFTRG